jgi:hypothetical protein
MIGGLNTKNTTLSASFITIVQANDEPSDEFDVLDESN